jgi:hypothetical protein
MTESNAVTPNETYILEGWLRLNREAVDAYGEAGLAIHVSEAGYVIHSKASPDAALLTLSADLAAQYQRIGALLAVSNLILTAQREKNSHARVAELYTQVNSIMVEYGFSDDDLHRTLQRIAESSLAPKRPKFPPPPKPE